MGGWVFFYFKVDTIINVIDYLVVFSITSRSSVTVIVENVRVNEIASMN